MTGTGQRWAIASLEFIFLHKEQSSRCVTVERLTWAIFRSDIFKRKSWITSLLLLLSLLPQAHLQIISLSFLRDLVCSCPQQMWQWDGFSLGFVAPFLFLTLDLHQGCAICFSHENPSLSTCVSNGWTMGRALSPANEALGSWPLLTNSWSQTHLCFSADSSQSKGKFNFDYCKIKYYLYCKKKDYLLEDGACLRPAQGRSRGRTKEKGHKGGDKKAEKQPCQAFSLCPYFNFG